MLQLYFYWRLPCGIDSFYVYLAEKSNHCWFEVFKVFFIRIMSLIWFHSIYPSTWLIRMNNRLNKEKQTNNGLLKSRCHTFCKTTRLNPSSNYLESALKTLAQLIGISSVILSYITVITELH